ncbi:hypothetical protein KC340_g1587 [Hortaea werneckii]|nr:hypothetical protein KC342_g1523 [Hortaea werneckii]KAI7104389.1 hypothetical protein KC339_g4587 [Hortaea werneckii]KAI7235460.1 hypothetical protein KC365_g5555 [Hortaea werneckii]KAI7336678.1 hypothetical protein KC340_g1587 [Hortaea werneckii]KAI7405324.1 hypothetical protein KC328_g1493 [Hortaea werneckii]
MELEAPPSHQVKHPRFEDEKLPTAPNGLATQDSTLEVDLLILDYITYQATNACLSSRDLKPSTSFSLPNNLAMSDSLLALFQARHPGHQLDAELHFRLLLLKLTALFAQRLTRNPTTPRTSALEELRQNNQDRAREWIANEERIPSYGYNTSLLDNASAFPSHDILERNRAHVLHGLNVPAEDEAYEDAHYGTPSCLSLLDLLPLFMEVSAARQAMLAASVPESELTEQWMQLACSFMLQACLEQYLVVGASGTDAIDEAFAWGLKAKGREEDANDEINDMFEDPVHETEVQGWANIKRQYLERLLPSATENSWRESSSVPSPPHGAQDGHRLVDLISRLENTATQHPIFQFESDVLGFLHALSESIERPVLVQLEAGQLDGMSTEETTEFIKSCGLSTGKLMLDSGVKREA